MKNYYKILEVSQNASSDIIKVAYRCLVKKFHPDSGVDTTDFGKSIVDINEAYETLSDSNKRESYDAKIQYEEEDTQANDYDEKVEPTEEDIKFCNTFKARLKKEQKQIIFYKNNFKQNKSIDEVLQWLNTVSRYLDSLSETQQEIKKIYQSIPSHYVDRVAVEYAKFKEEYENLKDIYNQAEYTYQKQKLNTSEGQNIISVLNRETRKYSEVIDSSAFYFSIKTEIRKVESLYDYISVAEIPEAAYIFILYGMKNREFDTAEYAMAVTDVGIYFYSDRYESNNLYITWEKFIKNKPVAQAEGIRIGDALFWADTGNNDDVLLILQDIHKKMNKDPVEISKEEENTEIIKELFEHEWPTLLVALGFVFGTRFLDWRNILTRFLDLCFVCGYGEFLFKVVRLKYHNNNNMRTILQAVVVVVAIVMWWKM